jgi:acetyl-CoA carboxylase carboxyl transferase subunit alpha
MAEENNQALTNGSPEERIAQLEEELRRLKTDAPASESEETPPSPTWQRVLLARHPKRPHSLDYIERILSDFTEFHGDRGFADDPAIVAGMGFLDGRPIAVIGQQKGRDTKQKLYRNFGMPKPEGYRKALRIMRLAAKFGRPILTLLDTPGAYPGVDAEERGQAEAIAVNLREMSRLGVPIIVAVIGEGGSGGALALGVGNRVLMMENAIYSVISPESCAAIIYRDASQAERAAAALKLTAPDLLSLGLIDQIVPEPGEGAHSDWDQAAQALKAAVCKALEELGALKDRELVDQRYAKFRKMGSFFEESHD